MRYTLDHVVIAVPDVRVSAAAYQAWFGSRIRVRTSGEVWLQHDDPAPLVLRQGDGRSGIRYAAYLAAHGPGYDHICFSTADPASAYLHLVDNGAPPLYEPVDYYGNVLAWVEDPQRVHVELMKPISEDALAGVLRGEPPHRFTTLA